jgi:hypothetical protein
MVIRLRQLFMGTLVEFLAALVRAQKL